MERNETKFEIIDRNLGADKSVDDKMASTERRKATKKKRIKLERVTRETI